MKKFDLAYRHAAVIVRYQSVFFPFDTLQLARHLPSIGFLPPADVDIILPPGASLEASGIIGRKVNSAVRADPGARQVGVQASDPLAAVEDFAAVETLIAKIFDINSSHIAQFYEFGAGMTVKSANDLLVGWRNQSKGSTFLGRLSSTIGFPVIPYGLRLAGEEQSPNTTDWFDIRIEPLIQGGGSSYLIEIVYRNADWKNVNRFARQADNMVKDLLSNLGTD